MAGNEALEGRYLDILVVGLNYAPDFIGIPKYTTELCEDLVRRGHAVTIVTAPPYYPNWTIPAEYRGAWRSQFCNGVKVVRCPLYVPSHPSGFRRLLHHLSFAISSFPASILAASARRPDVVLAIAPSLLSAPIVLSVAKMFGRKTWLHIQDFEVDAAFELGLLKGHRARRLAEGFERALLRAFDRVSTISESMRRLLLKKGVRDGAALEVRNWVDVEAVKSWPSSQTAYRQELNIPPENIVALYSGNMSGKQGLETLSDVAGLLEESDDKVTLILCGQGPLREQLEGACEGRRNVRFIDLQPIERLPELLATADIHLLPQRAEAADLVLPSKLTGMLSSGRPVVAMADEGTGLAEEVEGCGILVRPGDGQAMANAIIRLANDGEERRRLGRAARRRAESRWRMASIIDGFEVELRQLASS
jgi:colanic acid biosynthesis glycosyl transferase WcaI